MKYRSKKAKKVQDTEDRKKIPNTHIIGVPEEENKPTE